MADINKLALEIFKDTYPNSSEKFSASNGWFQKYNFYMI